MAACLHIRKRHNWSDEHLTKSGSYAGIPIVSPRRFLEILDEQQR
jgi:hypothetical protein